MAHTDTSPSVPLRRAPKALVRWLGELRREDVPLVGGKNASLGEMLSSLADADIRVPDGFATTSQAYWRFVDAGALRPVIEGHIAELHDGRPLHEVGLCIRDAFLATPLPKDLRDQVSDAYAELSRRAGADDVDVAVRSSATAEDLPDASFAGQQESFLNIHGDAALHDAVRRCIASLFTDRAIAYREAQGFDHLRVALSVGIQQMVRADLACAGTMFTLDTDTGFPHVVQIDAAWGLGEGVVSGTVDPDGYTVFAPLLDHLDTVPIIEKRCGSKETIVVYAEGEGQQIRTVPTPAARRNRLVLDDHQILTLARWAKAIETHYECPMDIEWAMDGRTDQLFVVQARPETVQSRTSDAAVATFELTGSGPVVAQGLAVGEAIAAGPVVVIYSAADISQFEDGAVLVTSRTDPDWVPIMKRASAIVTDHGGRTAHAAIVSRELGIPAVVGTGDATRRLADADEVTVSCADGEIGTVYRGRVPFERHVLDLHDIRPTMTTISLNLASPGSAFRWWRLPARGVGLARMEFIVNDHLGVHPLALTRPDQVEGADVRQRIAEKTSRFDDPAEFFIEGLALGIARIAASQWPDPVTVRMSDFKTNEYADLLGGTAFEPVEENPMIGFRGASRYYSEDYADGFALECAAIRRVRRTIGLTNVRIMIPFVRTVDEADRVLAALESEGLRRGVEGLEIWMMAEVPSNAVLAHRFATRFDGFSIGSNDLTQLTLGIDRESSVLASLFDERDDAVVTLIEQIIQAGHAAGIPIGICGQAPSDHPEFAAQLVRMGIDSISVNPDSALRVHDAVTRAEAALSNPPAQSNAPS